MVVKRCYFPLKRGTRQGDPISAYLFNLVLEIVFMFIKESENVQSMAIFNNQFLCTAYADDTTFFLSYKNSVMEVIQIFEYFSIFSGLKPNKSKCEIASVGVLKVVQMVLCVIECVNLKNNTIKILGIHFSYNRSLENDENYRRYIKFEKLLKLWRMQQLTIEGKILVFKTLAISKVVDIALVKDVPSSRIAQLEKIQKQFIWKNGNPKLKHTTLCNRYEQGGLKNVDIFSKIKSLRCSWVERLYMMTVFMPGK